MLEYLRGTLDLKVLTKEKVNWMHREMHLWGVHYKTSQSYKEIKDMFAEWPSSKTDAVVSNYKLAGLFTFEKYCEEGKLLFNQFLRNDFTTYDHYKGQVDENGKPFGIGR